jgi:hypothetical protein
MVVVKLPGNTTVSGDLALRVRYRITRRDIVARNGNEVGEALLTLTITILGIRPR